MQPKHWYALLLLLLVPVFLSAQTGKIRGKVVDETTKEPLIGANIVVEGTSMGAATDVNGEYLIINVEAGAYTLRASYVGYRAITVTNVRVNLGLTTEQNFNLPGEGVAVPTVQITAERPLVNKNATNAVRIIDGDFFNKLPARGINAAIALQPGVVQIGNNFYVRGSRQDEVSFSVDGVSVTDVINGGRGVDVTAEAVEQVQVLAGGYQAEFGGANAGLVRTQLKSGSESWKFAVLGETDRFAKDGKQFLKTYSYGYQDFTGTFGGPVFSDQVRFFGSAQTTHYSSPNVRVWDGYDYTVVSSPVITPQSADLSDLRQDTLHLLSLPGNIPGGYDNRSIFSGTMGYYGKEFQVRVGGSYAMHKAQSTTTFANIFNMKRLPISEDQNGFGNLKITSFFGEQTFAEASFNYYFTSYKNNYDPDFGDNLFLYGDSAANAALGYTLKAQGQNLDPYTISLNDVGTTELPQFNQYGRNIAAYSKGKQTGIGGRLDVTSQIDKKVELKFGGEYTTYNYRTYNPANVMQWALVKQQHPTNQDSVNLILQGYNPNNIGYDLYGNEISNDVVVGGAKIQSAPRKPAFAGAYVQSKIEMPDIVLNLGLRYDYIKSDGTDFVNPGWILRNDSLNAFLANQYKDVPAYNFVSPRLGFSFPVTDRTVFHAQYGRFIQMPRLLELYRGPSSEYAIVTQKGGYFYTNVTGYGIKPEQTTQYEIGFNQQLSENAAFDITAFYKNIQDQLLYMNITPDPNAVGQSTYPAFVNGDFATTKGIEFKFTLRRTNRVQASLNYALSDARGTGSSATTMAGTWGAPGIAGAYTPKYVFPLTFNQAHRGNFSIDYRFAKNDGGPILEQLGLNLLGQFNSGTNFTRISSNDQAATDSRNRYPVEEVGASTTPWFFQLDARLDKTFSIGPVDMNLYVYVVNLLGTNNAVSVFTRSGDPKDDGWLATSSGQTRAAAFGTAAQTWMAMYNQMNQGLNANNFGPPRQIRLGLRVDY